MGDASGGLPLWEWYPDILGTSHRRIFSTLAIASTFALLYSPWPALKQMRKSGTSVGSKVGFIPLFAMLLNNTVGFTYGVVTTNYDVMGVNGFGSILCLVYVLTYLRYSDNRRRQVRYIGIFFLGLAALEYYLYSLEQETRVDFAGVCNNIVYIIMLSSPLSQACQVVKHRSTANASWGLTISCAANSFFWAAYAHVIDDWYLLFPPLLGMVLAAMQISLLIIFSKRCLGIHPKKKEKEAVEMAPQAGKSKSSPSCKASKSAVSVPNARLGKNGNASSDKDGAQVAAELP